MSMKINVMPDSSDNLVRVNDKDYRSKSTPNLSNRVKVYKQDDQIKLVQTVASYSTMMSSFAAEAKDYILSFFPKDYFRNITIDTANARTLINTNKLFNKNLNKIPYPSLMMSPEIVMENPSDSMSTNPIISNPDLWLMKDMNSYYYKLLFDPDKKISMYYTCDYATMNFNVRIAVKSFIQNANAIKYIQNKVHVGLQQYINTRFLNTEIPKTFIAILAYLFGYDTGDSNDMSDLQLYLMQASRTYDVIRKKINLATGKTCFFLNDMTDVIAVIDDFDAPSSFIRDGQTEGEYILTFRLQLTALVANNFIMSIDRSMFKRIADNTSLLDELTSAPEDDVDETMYSLSIKNPLVLNKKDSTYFTDSAGEEHIGQNIVNETLTYDVSNTDLHINARALVQDGILEAHSYMVAKNIDPSSLLYVRASDNLGIMNSKKCSVDYNTLEVDLNNVASDIGISIFVDRATLETINKAQADDKFYFKDNFLTTLTINIEDEDGTIVPRKVVIKAFENDKEMESDDVNKQLRVNTIYGVGYVYLVNENDPNASQVKVCMGQDKYGNNIIKSMVLTEE